jgi:hypothetical protein
VRESPALKKMPKWLTILSQSILPTLDIPQVRQEWETEIITTLGCRIGNK